MYLFAVQSLRGVLLFVTLWTAAHQASLSFTISQSLLKFKSIELVMLSNHFILCHPLLLRLQSFPASGSFPMSWLYLFGTFTLYINITIFFEIDKSKTLRYNVIFAVIIPPWETMCFLLFLLQICISNIKGVHYSSGLSGFAKSIYIYFIQNLSWFAS